MSDSFTEVTEQGWLSQITGSIKSVLVGLILFVVAFPALFINEGCYVKTKKALEEGQGAVVSVDPGKVDPGNEGKLVHMIGEATTDAVLTDDEFGVSENAIKLRRSAEMYQWDEEVKTKTTKKTGGKKVTEKTYSYKMVWSEDLINSSNFKKPDGHQNPASMPFNSDEWTADEVTLGAFKLSDTLVGSINKWEGVEATEENLASLPEDMKARAQISNGGIYIGNPSSPAVGDTRINFKAVKPTTVSLYASQVSNTFEPYVASNGKNLIRLELGSHTANAMFEAAQSENVMMTWIIRIGGTIMMAIGISMVFSPLVAIANVLPFLGDLIQGGAFIFGGIVALALSFITISIAWLFYRPLIGIPLLLVGVGAVVGFIVLKKKGKSELPPAETPPAQPPGSPE